MIVATGIAPATVTLLLLIIFAMGLLLGVMLGAIMAGRGTGG